MNVLISVGVLVLGACVPRTDLVRHVPSDASPEELVAELSPLDGDSSEPLSLANGLVVEDPTDLLPFVPQDSSTARAARAWSHQRTYWRRLMLGLMGVAAVGATLLGLGLRSMRSTRTKLAFIVPGALLISSTMYGLCLGSGQSANTRHRRRAFKHYWRDLRRQLVR